MPPPLDVTVTELPNGNLLCFGRLKMQPTTAEYARVSNFRLPMLQVSESVDPSTPGTPVVQVSIDCAQTDYTREMVVSTLTFEPETDGVDNWLLPRIDAGTPNAFATPYEYFCNLTVLGTPNQIR